MASNNNMSRANMIQKLVARVEQLEVEIREFQHIESLNTRLDHMEAKLRELQQPQQRCLATRLANASPTKQKMILYENLYPLVEQIEGKARAAAKITYVILGMDVSEVLYLLESPEDLKAKVGEAMEFLGF